jgi:hypothetical protein
MTTSCQPNQEDCSGFSNETETCKFLASLSFTEMASIGEFLNPILSRSSTLDIIDMASQEDLLKPRSLSSSSLDGDFLMRVFSRSFFPDGDFPKPCILSSRSSLTLDEDLLKPFCSRRSSLDGGFLKPSILSSWSCWSLDGYGGDMSIASQATTRNLAGDPSFFLRERDFLACKPVLSCQNSTLVCAAFSMTRYSECEELAFMNSLLDRQYKIAAGDSSLQP